MTHTLTGSSPSLREGWRVIQAPILVPIAIPSFPSYQFSNISNSKVDFAYLVYISTLGADMMPFWDDIST